MGLVHTLVCKSLDFCIFDYVYSVTGRWRCEVGPLEKRFVWADMEVLSAVFDL